MRGVGSHLRTESRHVDRPVMLFPRPVLCFFKPFAWNPVFLPSWMELAAAEPFDGDLRLGSDAEQGLGI